jgi:hypothetical protein
VKEHELSFRINIFRHKKKCELPFECSIDKIGKNSFDIRNEFFRYKDAFMVKWIQTEIRKIFEEEQGV